MTRESKILIAVLVLIVGAMVGVFLLANGSGSTNNPKGDKTALTRPDTYKQGTGSVQVVEYGDYQCPACGAAYPVVKQLQQDLPGQFTLYFRNFPLTQLHANAMLAANAAEAAGAQGKYWEMHDKLYESQKDWSNLAAGDAEAKLVGYAKDLGLDADKFKQAVDSTQ
ncbi:MAG TPA: thioredoxin domain-containing protein, partial [Candidatus Saccharimonas sp.]|nr:thioredoxin domain-containing protein [Candidatus Saccharimonas sp.]